MVAADVRTGSTLEFIQELGREALGHYQADATGGRAGFIAAMEFAQGLLVPPTVTRTVSTVHDPVKREYPVTLTYEGGTAHRALGKVLDDLQAAHVVVDESKGMTFLPPEVRAANKAKGMPCSAAGKTVWSADPAKIVADTKAAFGLS